MDKTKEEFGIMLTVYYFYKISLIENGKGNYYPNSSWGKWNTESDTLFQKSIFNFKIKNYILESKYFKWLLKLTFFSIFIFLKMRKRRKLDKPRRNLVFMLTISIFIKYLLPKYGNNNIFHFHLEENELRSATHSFKSLFLILK